MKTPLTYGLGAAAAGAVSTLLVHLAGYLTDPEKFGAGLLILTLTSVLIIPIASLILGLRARRRESGPAGFSYGEACKTGLLIALFATLASLVFNVIYFKFINPTYTDTSIEWMRSMMERMHASDAMMEKTEANMRAKSDLSRQMIGGLVSSMVWNAILTLILAAIMKRAPAESSDQPLLTDPETRSR